MNAQSDSRMQPAPSAGRARVARVATGAIWILLVLTAVVLLVGSFASYAAVKRRLDTFASDHDAALSRRRFGEIVWQLRFASVLCLAVGAALHARRRRVATRLDALFSSAAVDVRAGLHALRRGLAAVSRVHLAALAAISFVTVLVRVDFLFQPMRYDEADTYVHYASRPLYIGLSAYSAPNNHLLHTLLVHVSTAVLGDQPWAIRLPTFTAGVLLVPATYLLARLLYGGATGLLAAALVATSSTLVEYSTNARGYTLLTLIFLLSFALATRLRENASPSAWAAFALLGALGIWTIPTMTYALGTVVVWLAWTVLKERCHVSLLRTRLLPALAGTVILTLVLYAPVLATSGPYALTANSFVAPRTWSYVGHHLPSSLSATFVRWHRDQPAALWLLLAAGFIVAVAFHARLSRFRIPPAAGAFVAIPPILVAQRVVPFERVWLFLLPLYLMSAAAGLLFVVRRLLIRRGFDAGIALLAIALCGSLAGEAVATRAVYRSEDTSTFRDAPAVAALLERTLRSGDRVLAAPPADQILEYYFDTAGLDGGRLLYTGSSVGRLFAVVKEGPNEYPLSVVLRRHLTVRERARLRPTVLKRFSHAVVYRLLR